MDFVSLFFTLFLSGLVSYVLTYAVKMLLGQIYTTRKKKEPAWHNGLLRLCAIVIGAITGVIIETDAIGVLLGIVGGGLNTFLVSVFKTTIKRKSNDV